MACSIPSQPGEDIDHIQAINASDAELYKCSEWEKQYKHFKTLKQHVADKHVEKLENLSRPGKEKLYKCDKCSSSFSAIYSLNYHKHKVHGEIKEAKREFQCCECHCSYSTEKNLKSNFKSKHAIEDQNVKSKIKINGECPMCNCLMQEGASLHFSSVHNININIQTLEFTSLSEFICWKENMEKETISKFVKRRGSKNAESHTTHYYICHRSGNFISESKGQRCLKTQGSNKIGGVCPASMTVKEDNISGKCDVTFVKSHVSHENTIGHVFLTPEERKQLAVKIASNVI